MEPTTRKNTAKSGYRWECAPKGTKKKKRLGLDNSGFIEGSEPMKPPHFLRLASSNPVLASSN
jgi:hypothetical protein